MLQIYNSLTRQKEYFRPINEGHVGMYVCGPTVYGDSHLGHARSAITFDILFRYLRHLGFKVRYVRNITDVGHLEYDADDGEDKIQKKAKLENIEPMEVAQYYANRYHQDMAALNVLPPSIEPTASGHIIEQLEFIRKIMANGFAYVSNGSVYLDVEKYAQRYPYGRLSGRNLENLKTDTRELSGQDEKKHPYDFALWKKADDNHIMHWPSEWSEGFPGWHLECSTMSTKYLGDKFDIHGGGLDLIFPHHEAEIAQSCAALGFESVRYWMHNNMITVAGKKMGKSYNNFITLEQFFTGNHPLLTKKFSPMTIRFLILMAHYRSTIDFSSEALEAAEKGFNRFAETNNLLQHVTATASASSEMDENVARIKEQCNNAMDDDLNTPTVIAQLFEVSKLVNAIKYNNLPASAEHIAAIKQMWKTYAEDILGFRFEASQQDEGHLDAYKGAVDLLMRLRQEAKEAKNWSLSDSIRDQLTQFGFKIKDTKDGCDWTLE